VRAFGLYIAFVQQYHGRRFRTQKGSLERWRQM
jgi:hypothetical protein